jgi:hypothetical protein
METIYSNIKIIASYLSIQDIIHLATTNKQINNRLLSTLCNLKQLHLSRFAIDSEIEELVKCLIESKNIQTKYGNFRITIYGESAVIEYTQPLQLFHRTYNYHELSKQMDELVEINDYTGVELYKNALNVHGYYCFNHGNLLILIMNLNKLNQSKGQASCKIFIGHARFMTHVRNMIRKRWKCKVYDTID